MEIPGYEIKRLIGQGGMAHAYLAVQTSLGRAVVLKVLETGHGVAPAMIERFLNEGRLIATLKHPNIITIYDIGQSNGKVYISMEYIEGGDLKQRMQHKVFAPVEAIDVIEAIASGLACAHDNGIVHRDVKPGNILFRRDGTPILSDFGIAKRLSGDSDLTTTGMFLGSPNYMAPEQSEAKPVDGRVDIYSLGIILYEMLTGKRVYTAESVIDVILMHKQAPLPVLPAGLEQFQELLNLMLAKDRTQRFRDARSLLHFISELRRRGVIKSIAQMTAAPDIDVTGEHDEPDGGSLTITRLVAPPRRAARVRLLLLGGLLACGVLWAALLVIEWRLTDETPATVPPAALDSLPVVTPVPLPVAETPQIIEALMWLGRRSLDEFRLTAPPGDNAYYYFARLLQLEPDNAAARAGLNEIATRYAMLAERELAQGHGETAQAFIGIGLELDPDNAALAVLRDLMAARKPGFWDALKSFFQ